MDQAARSAVTQKQVLIADDSRSSRDLLRHILQRCGLAIVEASDGETALAQAALCQPDLFILDLNMPRVDGYGVATILRSRPAFQRTPILALSAEVSQRDAHRIKQAGFSMYVSKPISPARLRDCVARLLNNPEGL